jgi:hypothetical protein
MSAKPHFVPARGGLRWTRLPAGLLALLVLLGAFELHPHGESHLGPVQTAEFFPEAAHPDQPLHAEAAAAAERPHCTVCFHRLQTSGADLPTAAVGVLPIALDRLVPDLLVPPAEASRPRHGGRAPPLS